MLDQTNVFFDCEFTELSRNAKLISIGMVRDEHYFYAENSDATLYDVNDWIKENVIKKLLFNKQCFAKENQPGSIIMKGDLKDIASCLKKWLDPFENVQFFGDVCHYDMMLLISLFGTAFDIPKNWNASCHDINQDIASCLKISEKEAFDFNREELAFGFSPKNTHNALYDAFIARHIMKKIKDDWCDRYDINISSKSIHMTCSRYNGKGGYDQILK